MKSNETSNIVYLLAGGRSQRFGENKALHPIAGRPWIVYQADQWRALGWEPVVIGARHEDYAGLGLEVLIDEVPFQGPLAGLERALEASQSNQREWFAISSCDLLQVEPSWLNLFYSQDLRDKDAVAFYDTCWQPFPSWFCKRAYATVHHFRLAGNQSFQGLFRELGERVLPLSLQGLPPIVQANTRAELDRFVQDAPEQSGG